MKTYKGLKKDPKRVMFTVLIFIIPVILWLGYTIYAAMDSYADNTLSNVVLALQMWSPMLTAMFGSLMGHWTWSREVDIFGSPLFSLWFLIVLVVALGLTSPLFRPYLEDKEWILAIVFQVYYILGHFLWPQDLSFNTAKSIIPFW